MCKFLLFITNATKIVLDTFLFKKLTNIIHKHTMFELDVTLFEMEISDLTNSTVAQHILIRTHLVLWKKNSTNILDLPLIKNSDVYSIIVNELNFDSNNGITKISDLEISDNMINMTDAFLRSFIFKGLFHKRYTILVLQFIRCIKTFKMITIALHCEHG